MCGRFVGFSDEDDREITEIINTVGGKTQTAELPVAFKIAGEIFPTDCVPVLYSDGGKLTATVMRWGYPGYPDKNNPKRKPPLINAKSETAATLFTWRDSVTARRCVIPSSGFYEWQHGGMNDKVKYKFNLPDAEALYMAAIYKVFHVADGSQIRHFSILTAAANDSMRDVHSRMPVVLRRGEFDEWLYGDYARLWERRDVLLERKAVA